MRSPGVLTLDCKALWDYLKKSESSALGIKDKRMAIEALALKRSLVSSNTVLRRVHSLAQLAGCMRKDSEVGRQAFMKYLPTGRWKLVDDPKFMSARRRADLGLHILAEPPAEGHDLGAGSVGPRDATVVRAMPQSKHMCWLQRQWSASQEGRVKG